MIFRPRSKSGFTLIELMMVSAIIGLLAAIAIPKFGDLILKAREATMKGNLGTMRSAMDLYYANNEGGYPGHLTLQAYPNPLTTGGYINKFPYVYNPNIGYNHGGEFIRPTGVFDAGASGPPPGSNKGYFFVFPDYTLHLNCTHTDSKGFDWSRY